MKSHIIYPRSKWTVQRTFWAFWNYLSDEESLRDEIQCPHHETQIDQHDIAYHGSFRKYVINKENNIKIRKLGAIQNEFFVEKYSIVNYGVKLYVYLLCF